MRDEHVLDEALQSLQSIWASSAGWERWEFELRRQEKIIRGFCRTSPARAYYLLGLVATLRQDVVAMHSCFRNALLHSSYDADIQRGYGICLVRLRFFTEAREQYEAILARHGEDLETLAELIITSLATGRIQEGVRWMQHWSQLSPDRPFEEMDAIAKSAALLERYGISDDHVERLQKLATAILARESLKVQSIHYRGVPLEEPQWIAADMIVDESEEVLEDLNGKLSRILHTNAPPPRLAEVIKFTYSTNSKSVP
ncbi:hypothetical protein [Candidatus Magnetaquicoccus inordinatus]|uniref:hypothetical protein n=1 Tax=Candidatus Magnetaquicoccus inordinatus TaxID=2496818 RepID=UPI00102C3721|nr:hypothetical protein [Candidatus Magnetaquicoccus inordinatus]